MRDIEKSYCLLSEGMDLGFGVQCIEVFCWEGLGKG